MVTFMEPGVEQGLPGAQEGDWGVSVGWAQSSVWGDKKL